MEFRTGAWKLVLFTSVVASAVTSLRGDSEVTEISSSFSCCSSPEVQLSPNCDEIWTIHGRTFAISMSSEVPYSGCGSPCKTMDGEKMLLDACVDVNLTTVCTEQEVTVERRIYFLKEPCSEPRTTAAGHEARAAGSLLLVLVLVLVLVGWLLMVR